MGLMSFIKSAGEKLFGGDPEPAKIEDAIAQHNLNVDGLNVVVNDDTVTLQGTVANQETREKVLLIAGNVDGIAAVDDQLTVTTPEPESQFHTVVSGDTLGAIAKKFYGDTSKFSMIFEANKPMLTDPNLIYPGQVLRIPTKTQAA